MLNIEAINHIYFLGIGGIGMSALARYFKKIEIIVSGYDRECTELTKKLEAEGMKIHYETNTDLIPDKIDLVIYTPAISQYDEEMAFLRRSEAPLLKRSEALQLILKDKKVIAVAGTHGKTTTSAMLAHILDVSGYEFTAFVGGIMNNYDSNFLGGMGDLVIIEADEYDRSFLRLNPEKAVIHAIDADHLDIYRDFADLKASFRKFTMQINPGGSLWVSQQLYGHIIDSTWRDDLAGRNIAVRRFGHTMDCEAKTMDIRQSEGSTQFDIQMSGRWYKCRIKMPGHHNVMNALAASALAEEIGVSPVHIVEALASFSGIRRRFEWIYRSDDLIIIDDYAHHPVEISAVIDTVRNHYDQKHLTVVFQPHLYSRTRDLQSAFARVLDRADEVYLLDIYPAREKVIEGISSQNILSHMTLKQKKIVKKDDLINHLDKSKIQILVFLGAGDIYQLIPFIKSKLISV